MTSLFRKIFGHLHGHFHSKYKSRFREWARVVFVIDGVLVSAILFLLVLGAYFAFFYHPLRDTFKIGIRPDGALRAGEPAAIVVSVRNDGKQALYDAKLKVVLPKQFRLSSFKEPAETNGVIEVGTMPPKSSQEYRFRGLLVGPPAKVPVFALMSARQADGVSDERLVADDLAWTENLVKASLEIPPSLAAGQSFPLTFKLENGSGATFEDVVIRPKWPESFTPTASSPPLVKGEMNVGELKPGDSMNIGFVGRAPSSSRVLEFLVEAYWPDRGERVLLAAGSAQVTVVTTGLRLEAKIADEGPLAPGSDVPVTVIYKNEGGYVLDDVRLSLPLDAGTTEAGPSSAEQGRAIDRALVWDGMTIEALRSLKPGDSGSVNGTVRLKTDFSEYVTNAALKLTPTAQFSIAEPKVEEGSIAGIPTETKIIGQAKLAVIGRYFTREGDQIGRGPLPPRVGKETRYWISAEVGNGTNPVRDSTLTIKLAPGIVWTGRASTTAGGDLVYEPATQTVSWRPGDLEAHAGKSSPPAEASFEVSLKPTDSQIGQSPYLVASAGFQGADAWTGLPLEATAGPVTTALPTDQLVAGRTVVRQ